MKWEMLLWLFPAGVSLCPAQPPCGRLCSELVGGLWLDLVQQSWAGLPCWVCTGCTPGTVKGTGLVHGRGQDGPAVASPCRGVRAGLDTEKGLCSRVWAPEPALFVYLTDPASVWAQGSWSPRTCCPRFSSILFFQVIFGVREETAMKVDIYLFTYLLI